MLKIKNVKTLDGKTTDLSIESEEDFQIDAEGTLTQLPALIHSLASSKKDLNKETLTAGFTTLLIAPEAGSPTSTHTEMQEKRAQIEATLAKLQLPLRPFFYLGDEITDTSEIGKAKNEMVALWVEVQELTSDWQGRLDLVFQVAAQDELVIAVRLGNNEERKSRLQMMKQLLELAEKYNTEIAFMDLTHRDEVDPIQEAKQAELMVSAATSILQLYQAPEIERAILWKAIEEGVIEMLSCEGISPSLTLPLLLTSYHERKITLEKIVACTRINIEEIFHLKKTDDLVLVNLDKDQTVREGTFWTGKTLRGWPLYTIVNGQIFRAR